MKLRQPLNRKIKFKLKKYIAKELWFEKIGIKVDIIWGATIKRKDLTIGKIIGD